MQRGIAAGQSIFEMLNRELEVDEGGASIGRATGSVEYRDLTFSYPGRNEPALKNISVTIAPGTKVALVGRSGSGKSTFVKLLSRFYEIQKGENLLILEAMKLENIIKAVGEGVVKAVGVVKGETVEKGHLLVEME